MNAENSIRRFYKIDTINGPIKNLGNLTSLLNEYLKPIGIEYQDMYIEQRHLIAAGMNYADEGLNVHRFIYPTGDESEADSLEKHIYEYAEKIDLRLVRLNVDLDFNAICEKNAEGLDILEEEVATPKNILEVEDKVNEYIKKLDSENNTLIITDKYILRGNWQYICMLERFLRKSHARKVVFAMPDVTDAEITETNSLHKLKEDLPNITITKRVLNNCHDRFWVCKESHKGFSTGTSLNGMEGKTFMIKELDDDEIDCVLNLVKK